MQGPILSSYFWGYIVAQIPGGYIAEKFSAKWVMFFSVTINIICTLLTPVMANLHYGAMIAMRIGEGIGGGVTFPAMHVMLANWSPPNERSIISGITYAGTALGTVVSNKKIFMNIAEILIEYLVEYVTIWSICLAMGMGMYLLCNGSGVVDLASFMGDLHRRHSRIAMVH